MANKILFQFTIVFFALLTLLSAKKGNAEVYTSSSSSIEYATVKGEWKGSYIISPDVNLCSFNIFEEKGKWGATMDIPGSNAYDLPFNVNIEGNNISFIRTMDSTGVQISYAGTIKGNVINGTYTYKKKDYKATGVFQLMMNPSVLAKHQSLPFFEVLSVDKSQTFTNKSFSGRYLLIDFWSTTCKVCLAKRPVLEEVKELNKETFLEVLSIALDTKEKVEKFRKEKFPMQWKNVALEDAWEAKIIKEFGINQIGLPTTILVSPEGKILATTDQLTKDNLLKTLAKYIGNAKATN
ncbi:MAG TPA: TlpA disulfide reductase family protein [Segetibacter sp.]|jgi:thiol-disulfide isomerase/thioredoxin